MATFVKQIITSHGLVTGGTAANPTEADLSTSDVTTLDVSTSKHGFVPKAPNDAAKFLNGLGAWSAPASPPIFDAENKDASTIPDGGVCSTHTSGVGVALADASSSSQPACGLALVGAAPTFSVTVQTGGLFTLADWSAVTDAASATLSPHAYYFLSSVNPGNLTTVPPTTVGQVVQRVGRAVSADTLSIEIDDPILL